MNNMNKYNFRSFAGKSDFPKMAKLIQDIEAAGNSQNWVTAEDVERDYEIGRAHV